MELYFLKSTVCLLVFLLFYSLVLEKQPVHKFKRFYLLVIVAISFAIPSITFTEYQIVDLEPTQEVVAFSYESSAETIEYQPQHSFDWTLVLWMIYFGGVLFFGFRFLKNISKILFRISKNLKIKSGKIIKVLLGEVLPPHTFFNYIFLNKKEVESNSIPHEVLLHEITHAKQKHSLDLILVELLCVAFWFNPLFFWLKHKVRLNHEFLADHAVLKSGTEALEYQELLLQYASYKYQPQMVNAIHYSLIKKRFIIMKKRTSKKSVFLRTMLLLPLTMLLVFGFSENEVIRTASNQTSIEGVWLDEKTETYAFSILSNGNQLYFNGLNYNHPIQKIGKDYFVITEFSDLPISVEEDTGLLSFSGRYHVLRENSLRGKFEGNWKSIAGNIGLKIENYTDSFIWTLTKDGQTNSFYPKRDKEGFFFTYGYENWSFKIENGVLTDSNGITYARVLPTTMEEDLFNEGKKSGLSAQEMEEYNRLATKLKNNEYGQSRILVSEIESMQRLYQKMTKEEKLASEESYGFPKTSNLNNRKGVPQKQMEAYNKLAKKYNRIPIENRVIPIKDLRVLEVIYRQMTVKQKEIAQPFPECLPKNQKNGISDSELDEYNSLAKKYTDLQKVVAETRDSNFADGRSNTKKELARLIELYQLLSVKQKQNAEPFPLINREQNTYQKGASRDQMSEYNALARKYNEMSQDNMHIKMKEVERMKYIYNLMSEKQRADAEPFPDFPEPPAPPSTPNFPEPPKTIGNGNDLPAPPAPPTPPSPLDHAIEMAKKGADFYYEGEKISSDKAIELLKKNKSLNIDSRSNNGKKPTVRISKDPIKIGSNHKKTNIETGNISINGKELFYTKKDGVTAYFNTEGQQVDNEGEPLTDAFKRKPTYYFNGEKISSVKAHELLRNNTSIQVTNEDVTEEEYAIVLTDLNDPKSNYYNQNKNQNALIDLSEMISRDASFFYNDEPISVEKALWLTQNDEIERVQTIGSKNGTPKVYFWKKI